MPQAPANPNGGALKYLWSHWRKRALLSSLAAWFEHFLGKTGLDRGPWLTVAFASGIATWFILPGAFSWVLAILAGLGLVLAGISRGSKDPAGYVRLALITLGLLFALGVGVIWARSELVGAEPIARPIVTRLDARILERIEQPAQDRVRLILATRLGDKGDRVAKIRVNLNEDQDIPEAQENAHIRLRARLMPPSPPMLPGAYNFARNAWFQGFAATGSVLGEIELIDAGTGGEALVAQWQRQLSRHVRDQLGGSSGAIAATLASGDRGAIGKADEIAMRDAGLTHLLSISGLHVSAVMAASYILLIRLLAAFPPLALRVRLPLLASLGAALAGIGYTLLTGAQVPTVRSCFGALLVLTALAMGREALSLRMIAVAAFGVLMLWPESLVGPSFQMSFAAVITIVALHESRWLRSVLAPRDEDLFMRLARKVFALLITGLAIEFCLMPIVLFHFHRAGVYGAFANLAAIPLVTFVSMPLIALALLLDLVGLGAPIWWLAGWSLDLLLGLAHFTASQPGAVKLMPQMGIGVFMLFVAGGLWIALWRGRARLIGMAPVIVAIILLLLTPVPDLLITDDGRHVGITEKDGQLIMLRDSRSSYIRDNLMELSAAGGQPTIVRDWPQARCSSDFCSVTLERGGRSWHVLMATSDQYLEERKLAAACERHDIVVADRWLPYSCKPRWLKADRRLLRETGGLALNLSAGTMSTVAQMEGHHGWWRGGR
nr:ComEC/Rec2 family competence protein [Altericroceibacterium endophyticum]